MCRGIRAYRATEHATTGAGPNRLTFGRELRGKFPEVKGNRNGGTTREFAVVTESKNKR